jgi:broad specificity phosphatase PhoE
VVYSTLPRASVSADLLAKILDVPALPEQALQERDFGSWDSWEWPRISVELNKLSLEARYTFRPPGGETWQEMEDRLRTALKDIAALDYDTVAAVTHAGSIRVLLEILGTKTKANTINFIPGLGKSIVEEFDASSI